MSTAGWTPWPGVDVDPDATYGFAVLPNDCDEDGRPEIYVANDSNANLLYRFVDGALEDLSLLSGAAYSAGGLEHRQPQRPGARIAITSGDATQRIELRHGDGYLGSNDPRRLFALPSGRAELLRIEWPGGETKELRDILPGRVVIHEGRGIVARQ